MSNDPVQDSIAYEDKLEQETEEYQELIDFHKENWLVAVTKSAQQSFPGFSDNFYWASNVKYPATKESVFFDTLCNNDFEQRVAELLIDAYNYGTVSIQGVNKLFDDMSEDYAKSKVT